MLNLGIMGFGGSASAMITSLKNNDRRKKRKQFDKNKLGSYGDGEKMEFEFPEVTPEVLKSIRERLLKERKQLVLKRRLFFALISAAIILLLIYI